MRNKKSIILIMEVSDGKEISEIFRDRVPFLFDDEETAIDSFYYMAKNAKQYIHSAQFLKL